ncbi:MAG: hypothetical protein IPH68_01075 [Chitinophagaceae bacterium]|nr:hypothetical protein [Chitinophagaceae bacterium]MBK7121490.1 hypothetical protein [Chitinophagaceae bacterium]MBK7557291.1 hypothetical protein [Chitinophagaceae bacterium]MBK9532698.1 hypothetical protein [Chitinophagaceae bacterium]HQW92930.1 hypothetical protein [Ferruginibacter sp.]
MSIDNIQFPAAILQGLYSKSLYELESNESLLHDIQPLHIMFLGSNLKKIALVVHDESSIYLADDALQFLLGILTACKLSMADIALINVSKNKQVSYNTITEQLKAEKIIMFGLTAENLSLPLQFPHYQVQQYNNQVYLSAASLTDLQKDKEEKMKLWNCLKNIFSI